MKNDVSLESVNDIDLIKLVKSGNDSALNKLLDEYIPKLEAFFHYIHVPNDYIEDLIQETFERMLLKIDSYDETKKFSSWLMTIGRNIYIDQYRRETKKEELLNNYCDDTSFQISPEDETIGKISVDELLNKLDSREKFLIEARIFLKMSFAEISEITDEQENTLRTRFFRVLGKLKSIAS